MASAAASRPSSSGATTPPDALRWQVAAAALACAAPAAATPEQAASLTALAAQDRRVATVAFRLLTAATPLCPTTAPASGLTVHDLRQYGIAMRAEAARLFGLADRPAVAAVVPGGPADRAGIAAGDAIVAVAGVPVAPAPPGRHPSSHAATAAVEAALAAALVQGPVALTIARGGAERIVRLAPVPACASPVQVEPGTRADAWSDGEGVAITSALVDAAADDDELAFLLGHEIAHNILGHRARLAAQGVGKGLLSRIGPKAAKVRATEREADRVGLILAARAGYDPAAAARFWRRFGGGRGDGILADATHPGWRERADALAATAAAIAAGSEHSETIVP